MKRAIVLLALLSPLTALAEDEAPPFDEGSPVDTPVAADEDTARIDGPVTSPSQVPGTTTTTTTTAPNGITTTTTTTTTGAPGSVAPLTPAAPVVAPTYAEEESWCGMRGHAWRSRMKGRVSLGIAGSHIHTRGEGEADLEGHQRSFVARLNGHRGWALELEFSKLTLDGGDSARTGGVSLVKTFGQRKIAPYVIAGGGGGRYEFADGTEQKMHFGEIGGGVMLRGKRFSIGIDMRKGVRKLRADDDDAMRTTTPTGETDDNKTHYARGRILALFNF